MDTNYPNINLLYGKIYLYALIIPAISVSGIVLFNFLNKNDLHEKIKNDDSIIHISAKLGINVDFLLEKMKKLMSINPIASDTPHLTSQHQYTAINTSLSSQQTALGLLNHPLPEMELVAFELRESIDAIDTLLGKTSPDDILNNIFKTLCVGK